jgi:choice-of-anchor B domain-containing protein
MNKTVSPRAAFLLPFLIAAPLGAQSFAGAEAPPAAGFGTAVAVGGGMAFVGEGANVMRPGMVYVYAPESRGGDWTERARITAPDPARGDGFGRVLAAAPDRLLVGQLSDGVGSVHVYRQADDAWRHERTLLPDELPKDAGFGASLAYSDGVVAVGATGVGEGAGRVYLFRAVRNGWESAGFVDPGEGAAGDAFGAAVALDGTRMIVGAPGREGGVGAAYVFRLDPGTSEWIEESRLEGQDLERRASFGGSVALSGGRALVAASGMARAAGAVFEYELDPATETWVAGERLLPFDGGRSARFGSALAYRPGTAYVGAPGAGAAGAIYVMRHGEDGEWLEAEKLQAAEVDAGGGFGASLAIGGGLAVAGATREDYGAGAAVILTGGEGGWRVAGKVASEPESLEALTGRERRCEAGVAGSLFACGDVDLLSFVPVTEMGGGRGVRVNDVWGWTDPETGREYALVGRLDGASFVDITDPTAPAYLGNLPMTEGSNAAVWRDIKVYADHAFIVADGAGQHGMQVFDLTRLRGVEEPVTFDEDAHYDGIASTHNIVVDTASGFAFAVGARGGGETCGGGLHMIDIRDPTSPDFAGCFADPQTGRASTGYSHDAQCVTYDGPDDDYRGREVCFGANETALSIADVTDKENPVAVARASYPNVGYTHQGWLTPDGRYFYMNDELDELQGKAERTRTLIWDVADLDDPQLVGEFMGTTEASDHNLYIRGDLMYQSNYQAGLRIIDISDPESPREVGFFDTVPFGENTAGFGGSWSNYPYFPSGAIIVTSGREGLFVLKKREPVS